MLSFLSACLLGLVAGGIGRMLVKNDPVQGCVPTMAIGLVGSLVGWGLFRLIGIGDPDKFDWGGILGAIIGTVLVLSIWGSLVQRKGRPPGR